MLYKRWELNPKKPTNHSVGFVSAHPDKFSPISPLPKADQPCCRTISLGSLVTLSGFVEKIRLEYNWNTVGIQLAYDGNKMGSQDNSKPHSPTQDHFDLTVWSINVGVNREF